MATVRRIDAPPIRGDVMKEKTKDLWRAYLHELIRVMRAAQKDYHDAQDRWHDYSRDAPEDVKAEFE